MEQRDKIQGKTVDNRIGESANRQIGETNNKLYSASGNNRNGLAESIFYLDEILNPTNYKTGVKILKRITTIINNRSPIHIVLRRHSIGYANT